MKRIFTLLVVVAALAGNAWGQMALYFNDTFVELNFSTSAEQSTVLGNHQTWNEQSTSCYKYEQNVWWLRDGTHTNLDFAQDTEDFDWSIEVTGDISISSEYYESKQGNIYKLKKGSGWGHNIYFDVTKGANSKGTIIVTTVQPNYEGNPYSASYTISINNSVPSTKWDFYSEPLTVTNDNNWNSATYMGTEGSSPLVRTYKTAVSSSEDPLSIISGTKDLKFVAGAGQLGWYNDPGNNGVSGVRFIAIAKGAQLIIPSSVFSSYSHPKVRIKMGRYGGTTDDLAAHLTITNANDALGKEINSDYNIGGSDWWGTSTKKDYHQRGEYHFQIRNNSSDFTITMKNDQSVPWLMLYTIEVYDSETMITENSVLGNSYQLLNKYGQSAATGTYTLHYRGKGENTKIEQANTTGSVTVDLDNEGNTGGKFDHLSGVTSHTYTSSIGQVGSFSIRISCYDHSGNYCTDYADRRQSVGYMGEHKTYPYTWDFTDIKTYSNIGTNRIYGYGTGNSEQSYAGQSYEKEVGLQLWTVDGSVSKFGLELSNDGGHNVRYCGGSQLWYGSVIIPETEGLAFTAVNYDKAYNNSLVITSSGLQFDQEFRDWWGWRVTVPSVPANGVVYVRAKNTTTKTTDLFRHVKFWITAVGVAVNNKTEGAKDLWDSELPSSSNYKKLQVAGTTDEYIYAIYNDDASNAKDITLFFNGVEVQKIAVSTDKKTFNAKGWTTESREHDIDPSLTAEMNGRGIKTYLVTGVNDATKKVTMTDISNAGLMPSASDGSKYACILRNTEDEQLDVVGGGFYLFVPDIHDKQGTETPEGDIDENWNKKNYASSMESSIMKAQLNPRGHEGDSNPDPIPETEQHGTDTYTNYAFTYQYYDTNADGEVTDQSEFHDNAEQAFYRIAAGGATSAGHQGYLQVDLSDAEVNNSRVFTLSFGDDDLTVVEPVQNTTPTEDVYYNLSGQKLEGKPNRHGLYIVNGKKMYVK